MTTANIRFNPAMMKRRGHGRPRHQRGEMNKLERAYAAHLDQLKLAGQIDSYLFETITMTLADPPNAKVTRFTPDFAVYLNDMTLEFHECKGFMEGDALIKLKVAAATFPHAFKVVTQRKKSDGGGWAVEEM